MVGFDDGNEKALLLDGQHVTAINTNLSAASDSTQSQPLSENAEVGFVGSCKGGPFDITHDEARKLLAAGGNPNGRPNTDVLRRVVNSLDLLARTAPRWIIDNADKELADACMYGGPDAVVESRVKPLRDKNRNQWLRENWWRPQRMRPEMRWAIASLARFIVTPTTAKYRIFAWMAHPVLPDHQLIVFARSDDYFFGVLHSSIHELWARRMGTQLREAESGFRYTPTTCFETFPLPWPPGAEPAGENGVVVPSALAAALQKLPQSTSAALQKLPPSTSAALQNVPPSKTAALQKRGHHVECGGESQRDDDTALGRPKKGSDAPAQTGPPTESGVCVPSGLPAALQKLLPSTGVALHSAIAQAAAELNEMRERWLNPPEWIEPIAAAIDARDKFEDVPAEARPLIRQSAIMAAAAANPNLKKRTLTNLYNERPTWLKLAHKKLDTAVLAAYAVVDPEGGWEPNWADVWFDTGAGQPLPADHPLAGRRAEIDQKVLANLLRLNQYRSGR